jgi:hypothetical protein
LAEQLVFLAAAVKVGKMVGLMAVEKVDKTAGCWVEMMAALMVAKMADHSVGGTVDLLADTMVALTADALVVMLVAQTAFPLVEKKVVKWADATVDSMAV